MRAHSMLLLAVLASAAAGCATGDSAVRPGSSAPGAEACPATFDACVELCAPLAVGHFGCWSPVAGVDFDCQCLDGSRPLEDDTALRMPDNGSATRGAFQHPWLRHPP